MSKAEILAELPKLKTEELAEIQARIEELAVYGLDGWLVDDELPDAGRTPPRPASAGIDPFPGLNSSRLQPAACNPKVQQLANRKEHREHKERNLGKGGS
jgi:hypothetical protein